jgi:hypothetical protein
LNRPRSDPDLEKNSAMKRPCLELNCGRRKNGCFLCSSVNSGMRMMKVWRMTHFLVRDSVEMICMKRTTCMRTMTCTMRMMISISLRRNHNEMDGCNVRYCCRRMCFLCFLEEWTNIYCYCS